MNKRSKRKRFLSWNDYKYGFLTLAYLFIHYISFSQKADIRCLEVFPNGNVDVTWIKHIDPSGEFKAYQIWYAADGVSYSVVGTVTDINTTSFVHTGALADEGPRSYFILIEMEDASGNLYYLQASDTLKSMYVNMNTSSPQDGFVDIDWNALRNPPMATTSNTYDLYKKINAAGAWNIIDNPAFGTEFYNDPEKTCSDTLSFRVEMTDASGCVSVSNYATKHIYDDKAPGSPSIDSVSVDPETNEVYISWTPDGSGDIEEYIVIRDGIIIASIHGINNTSFIDANATPEINSVEYAVASLDSCGSNNASPTDVLHSTIYLEAVNKKCEKQVELTWSPYIGWGNGVLMYYVYVQEVGGALTLLDSVAPNTFIYVHENVPGGSEFCYFILAKKAQDANNITSKSNQKCITTSKIEPPEELYITCASVVDKGDIRVTFFVPEDSEPIGYKVFRSRFPEGEFEEVGYVDATEKDTLYSYKDNNTGSDTTVYYYFVAAVDSCQNPYYFSDTVNTVLLSGVAKEDIFENTLTWNFYTGFQSANGYVSSYKLYRSLDGDDDYVLLQDFQTETFFYIDDVEDYLSSNGQFCYYIEAVEDSFANDLGFQEVCLSNEICLDLSEIIWVPGAFTPDGDDLNDVFKPILSFVDEVDYKFIVYDRWGVPIFETAVPTQGFDGIGFPAGFYQYYIQYKNASSEILIRRGSFLLTR